MWTRVSLGRAEMGVGSDGRGLRFRRVGRFKLVLKKSFATSRSFDMAVGGRVGVDEARRLHCELRPRGAARPSTRNSGTVQTRCCRRADWSG